MILWFIRHGQTEDNLRGIIQGQLDTPLNDTGRNQARLLAQRLKDVKFDEAWSSSLSRARETAEILLRDHPELTLRTDSGLMERGLGSLEGGTWPKGAKLPDDVEASDVFRKRITDWFTTFLSTQFPSNTPQSPFSERNILITSHGAYLTTFLSILLRPPFNFGTSPAVDITAPCINTSIMKVHVRLRADMSGARAERGSVDELLQNALMLAEQQEMQEDTRGGVTHGESGMRWVGLVERWGDAGHLNDAEERKVGLADDRGDTEKP